MRIIQQKRSESITNRRNALLRATELEISGELSGLVTLVPQIDSYLTNRRRFPCFYRVVGTPGKRAKFRGNTSTKIVKIQTFLTVYNSQS